VYTLALTQGSTLVARFQVAGQLNNKIKVWLLDGPNYQSYVAHQQFSYFQGTSGEIRGTGHYIFQVAQTGLYYLLVDNSGAWLLPRDVQLYVYSVFPQPGEDVLKREKDLTDGLTKLGSLFIFPSFRVEIRHCGAENAFSNPNITICTELGESLSDQGLDQAIAFVFFHELGHTLLRLWGLPSWDNEDVADEFATVCIILSKQQEIALQAARWWASQTSEQEALAKLWVDDRHAVSPQRARNIIHWLSQQDDLLQRWMRLLVPHMQSSALFEVMADSRLAPTRDLIRAELRGRGCVLSNEPSPR
jgi:hypothetical protein